MFWAFGIAAIVLLAYFISAMACGWAWDKCGKKSSSSGSSNSFFESQENSFSNNPNESISHDSQLFLDLNLN
jgi:hypothetical protein